MSEEIFLEGKNYVSSKKASTMSGYAQDYIGQLARAGLIDAQRVGGLWYVSMDSLAGYQRNAASYTPVQPQKAPQDLDAIVTLDGKEYLAASRAAKMTGYNQDYIGQLARGGKLLSRQIGNRWYIEKTALLGHKAEKDRLLAAVQSESVGIARPAAPITAVHAEPLLNYFSEEKDLMPSLSARPLGSRTEEPPRLSPVQQIPIRVVETPVPAHTRPRAQKTTNPVHETGGKTIYRAAEAGIAFTFVLVLSYGLFSLKDSSIYAVVTGSGTSGVTSSALVGNAGGVLDRFTAFVEDFVAPELSYTRSQ